jgi:hypothetical protein
MEEELISSLDESREIMVDIIFFPRIVGSRTRGRQRGIQHSGHEGWLAESRNSSMTAAGKQALRKVSGVDACVAPWMGLLEAELIEEVGKEYEP